MCAELKLNSQRPTANAQWSAAESCREAAYFNADERSVSEYGPRAPRRAAWGAVLALVLSAVFILISRQGTWTVPQLDWDEGTRLSIASSLNHGRTLYVDAWDHHTFLDILLFQQLFRILPNDRVGTAVRVCNAGIVCLLCVAVYWGVVRFAGNPAWGLGASIAAGFLFAQDWAIPGHGEFYHSLSVALAFCLCFVGRRTRWRLALAGVLLGIGVFIKQTAVFDLAACIVLLICANRTAHAEGSAWLLGDAARQAGWLCLGVLVVAALCGVYFGAHGSLRAAVYATFGDPVVYSTGRDAGETLRRFGQALVDQLQFAGRVNGLITAGMLASWIWVLLMRPCSAQSTPAWRLAAGAGLWLAVDALGLALIGRFYAHYLVQLVVPASIFCTALLGCFSGWLKWAGLAPFVILLWVLPACRWAAEGRAKLRDIDWADVGRVVQFVKATTRPGEGIYLYQDSALCIYQLSERFPPTKVFMDHQFLPENKDGPALLREAMHGLKLSPPRLIIRGALDRSVPQIEAFLQEYYVQQTNFGVHRIFAPRSCETQTGAASCNN